MSIFTKERGNKTGTSKLNMSDMGVEGFFVSVEEGITITINTAKINYGANFAPVVDEVLKKIQKHSDELCLRLSMSDDTFKLISSISKRQASNTGMMLSVMEADMKRSAELALDDYESKREAYETATRRVKDDQDTALQLGVELVHALNDCYCIGSFEVF